MKKNKQLGKIIVVICIVVILFLIIRDFITKNKQNDIQNLANSIYEEKTEEVIEEEVIEEEDEIEEEVIEEVGFYDDLEIRDNFVNLRTEFSNDDIVGFLTIDETSIDYPVVQTTDNFYYLEKDLYKNPSIAGSIYLDYENDITKLDYNRVIYGHNMRDDIMFHSLRNYKDKEYFENNRYIKFSTLYNDYVYEVFSAYQADVSFPYITVLFDSEDHFYLLSNQFEKNSLYDTGVDIDKTDKVLTLSTCTSFSLDPDKRFVVHGKLISINGNEDFK